MEKPVQEFWFCESCKSMNRADSQRCYHCRAPRVGATMVTVQERLFADVRMPGVDGLDAGTARAMQARGGSAAAWPFGYVSAGLLLVPALFQVALALCELTLMVAVISPSSYTIGNTWWTLVILGGLGYGFTTLLAAAVHSVFLGLANRNVPSLGGGQPRFPTWRAAGWWIESTLWAFRANMVIWLPLVLALETMRLLDIVGMPFSTAFNWLFGVGLALGLTWLATWALGSPLYSLRKPARLLHDLTARLSLRESPTIGVPSMWSAAWGTARGIDAVMPLIVLLAALVAIIVAFLQMLRISSGSGASSELDLLTSVNVVSVGMILLFVIEHVASIASLVLLAYLTIALSNAERVRKNWVSVSARTGTISKPELTRPEAAPAGSEVLPVPRSLASPPAASRYVVSSAPVACHDVRTPYDERRGDQPEGPSPIPAPAAAIPPLAAAGLAAAIAAPASPGPTLPPLVPPAQRADRQATSGSAIPARAPQDIPGVPRGWKPVELTSPANAPVAAKRVINPSSSGLPMYKRPEVEAAPNPPDVPWWARKDEPAPADPAPSAPKPARKKTGTKPAKAKTSSSKSVPAEPAVSGASAKATAATGATASAKAGSGRGAASTVASEADPGPDSPRDWPEGI